MRSDCTSAAFLPSSRAASSGCGVSNVGARRCRTRSPRSASAAIRFSASASITAAVSRSRTSDESSARSRVGTESAADDDRLQIREVRQRAKHQFRLHRVDAEFGRAEQFNVDAPGAEPQRRPPAQQRRAHHAAPATDDEHVAVRSLVAVTTALAQNRRQVRRRDQDAVGRRRLRSDRLDKHGARGVDTGRRVQAWLVADEGHRRRGLDTRHAADPGSGVRVESARHIDCDDAFAPIDPIGGGEKFAGQRTRQANTEQRVDHGVEAALGRRRSSARCLRRRASARTPHPHPRPSDGRRRAARRFLPGRVQPIRPRSRSRHRRCCRARRRHRRLRGATTAASTRIRSAAARPARAISVPGGRLACACCSIARSSATRYR